MAKALRWLLLATFSYVLLVLLVPIVFTIQVIYRIFSKKYDIQYYLEAVAIGNDSAGGSYLYGSKFHTISAKTGELARKKGAKWHRIQEKIINFFFGETHCEDVAIKENLIKDK